MVWPSTTPDDVDSTILACIAFSCPNLAFLEISVSDPAVNRISRVLGRSHEHFTKHQVH
ncbi:hypothetical protein JHK82_055552 [Glycine max]|uniref:Uncharacterized protein n=2 Tax=Glycine subgen. Soja TaxID=1462606 RepID=A0A0R0EGB7_SOYBN|nr:hypothetical protein JHK86_055370 [Glycine max]KAG4909523.1 hypothetical protein JHK87_055639 [Glycine soja]KAG4918103.1 hypothetical protein JHK85_056384 [Glycine max]KAG5074179.1 hypothetical protein JHK84_055410 [Glycine max]KAG5076857.1 hypothetical protein JHK82_055552 [Glycine max]